MKFISIVFILIIHMTSVAMPLLGNHGQICVKSIDKLSCYYRDEGTTGKEVGAPLECSLDKEIYYKMAYMCTAVKILNGYLLGKGNIEDNIAEISYTPYSTNVLVPYFRFIKKEENDFKCVTKPWLIKQKGKEKCLVFVSGNIGTMSQYLSEAYNYFFNGSMSFGEIKVINNPKGQSKHGSQGHTEEALLDRLACEKFTTSCAVIVDMFSWLDPCSGCMKQMRLFKENKEQKLPIVFRVVSQRRYKNVLPVDLSGEYDGDPLFFQDLYKKNAILVTRIDPNIDRIRDSVIEKLHTGIIAFALQKDINFWVNVQPFIIRLALDGTSQANNVQMIFKLRFPIDCLLIQANNILRSEKNGICYQGIKVAESQLLDLFNNLKSISVSDDTLCPLFLKYFGYQTNYSKSGTALQWKKVLQGNIALRLAERKLDPSSKNDYINFYIANCLLYQVKNVWPLRKESISSYKKDRGIVYNDFNKPDNVENYNLEILEKLIT